MTTSQQQAIETVKVLYSDFDDQFIRDYIILLAKRIDKYGLINLNEDSVRSDFCSCLCESKNLKPFEIQLECPICEEAYSPRKDPGSKRKEKPRLDLDIAKLNISVEFALFRKNSNDKGPINKTDRLFKMFNDMVRLGLNSKSTNRNSYFICVADEKIIGHQIRNKLFNQFPADQYILDSKTIGEFSSTKDAKFDKRFVVKLDETKLTIVAKKVADDPIGSNERRLLIWKITTK